MPAFTYTYTLPHLIYSPSPRLLFQTQESGAICSTYLFVFGYLLLPTETGAQTCAGGIAGIESGDVCCVAECATCGGVGCTPSNTSTLTANDCCTTEIAASNQFCSETNTAPCILTTGTLYVGSFVFAVSKHMWCPCVYINITFTYLDVEHDVWFVTG